MQLAGTTVSRASLHNADFIASKDIRVGDMVVVEKAGEIIPYVVRSEPAARTGSEKVFHFPKTCPVCGSPVERDKKGTFYRCTGGRACTGQVKETLRAFARAQRHGHRRAGRGDHRPARRRRPGRVDSRSVSPDAGPALELERMGEKSAQNLLDGIAASKQRGLARLLAGLAIPHVGDSVADLLANEFGDIDALHGRFRRTAGGHRRHRPIMAESIHDYFHSDVGRKIDRGPARRSASS